MNRSPRFESITLGSTPVDEECAQLGSPDYDVVARAECARYKDLIVRLFGPPPVGVVLSTVGHSHDYGVYFEVSLRYEVGDADAEAYALAVDGDTPSSWDDDRPRCWRAGALREATP